MKPKKFIPKQFNKQNKNTQQQNAVETKFKGRVPIPKEKLEKHAKGKGMQLDKIKTYIHRKKFERKEKIIQFSTEQAARAEILLTEEPG